MRVDNQPRDFVVFIGHYCFFKEVRERQIGQRKLRRHALFGRLRSHPGQHIAAAQRRGLGQQFAQSGKGVSRCFRWCGQRSCFRSSVTESCCPGEEIV